LSLQSRTRKYADRIDGVESADEGALDLSDHQIGEITELMLEASDLNQLSEIQAAHVDRSGPGCDVMIIDRRCLYRAPLGRAQISERAG
jgi:hypothetical protein